jgi:hypothetical protein
MNKTLPSALRQPHRLPPETQPHPRPDPGPKSLVSTPGPDPDPALIPEPLTPPDLG